MARPPTINLISTAFTTPMLDATTDGREIVWSTGLHADDGAAPDLWRFVPGDAEPVLVFANPHRDATLSPIALDHGRYAFIEADPAAYGLNGYRLWLVPAAGAAAVEIDRGDWTDGEPNLPLPRLSLRADRLVWTAVHHLAGRLTFELLLYSLTTHTTTLLASSAATTLEYWDPSLAADGHRLVYATVTTAAGGSEFHVWYRDLAGTAPATRLDADGAATNPVLGGGDIVLWKHATGNVFNRGSLTVAHLPAAAGPAIAVHTIADMGLVTEPSAGARFAVAWRDQDHELRIVDPASGSTRVVTTLPAGVNEALVRPEIAGDLLVFVHGYLDASPLQLEWVDLSAFR
jgi:hypothetical protein